MSDRVKTTEEAFIRFLEQESSSSYSFAVELCEEIGFESFIKLMKKFSGLEVKFPEYEAFENFITQPKKSGVVLTRRRVPIIRDI